MQKVGARNETVFRVLAPSSDALAPSSDALVTSSFLLLVVWPEPLVTSLLLVAMPLLLVVSCYQSMARSPQ